MQVGHIIAKLRSEKKLSQKQLASNLNISTGVVGLWETDKRLPSFECILALADYFKVSTDVFFEKDRLLPREEYSPQPLTSNELKKITTTFLKLNDDNKDILIGKAKELLKEQRAEEQKQPASKVDSV